jgi:hypothetical protein
MLLQKIASVLIIKLSYNAMQCSGFLVLTAESFLKHTERLDLPVGDAWFP